MKWLNALYISFFTVNALSSALVTAFTGADWHDFTATQRFVVLSAVCGSWSNTMLALVITLAKREAAGKPLVPINGDGNTERIINPHENTKP